MARLGVSFSNLFRDGSWGGCRVHGVCIPPPPPPEITCGVVIQLVLCIKICLRHQPVTPFLSGVSPAKKNPGSTPFSYSLL